MAIVNLPWTIRQALDRGMEFYDVGVTDWGNIGAAADPVNENGVNQTPISDFPCQGIAIAPESIIDRCFLAYNPGQQVIVTANTIPPNVVVISKDQPYIGRLPAEYGVFAFREDIHGDAIVGSAGVGIPFGTALASTVYSNPSLQLRLLLKGSGLAPGGRTRSQRCDSFSGFTGAEDTLQYFPVHGRRRVRVSVVNFTGGTTIVWRVTVVRGCANRRTIPPPVVDDRSIETDIGTLTTAGASTDSLVISPLLGEYIGLYGELTVGGAAASQWNIEAED